MNTAEKDPEMPNVMLDPSTDEKLGLVAAALGKTKSDTVAELLRRLSDTAATKVAEAEAGLVPIHAIYRKQRIDATFDPATEAVTLRSDPWTGQSYKSPSRAAIEVVKTLNPKVHPNRNGWGFWTVDSTGGILDTIRRR